ncbi:hypothetical protein CN539_22115 [Bacillus toyonensis]|nr:hypothetical protein COO01_24110 [Bacillus toyonensis]PEM61211.1 hypothetical protein CN625_15570 [Bacillus toyonensis]PEN71564.1 hypothetical protein CN539_22115 [Bacillus toyonensis]
MYRKALISKEKTIEREKNISLKVITSTDLGHDYKGLDSLSPMPLKHIKNKRVTSAMIVRNMFKA